MQVKGIKLYLKPMGFLPFTRISCLSLMHEGRGGPEGREREEEGALTEKGREESWVGTHAMLAFHSPRVRPSEGFPGG